MNKSHSDDALKTTTRESFARIYESRLIFLPFIVMSLFGILSLFDSNGKFTLHSFNLLTVTLSANLKTVLR